MLNHKTTRTVVPAILCFTLFAPVAFAQQKFKEFDAANIFNQLDQQANHTPTTLVDSWWDAHVGDSLRNQEPMQTDMHTLLYFALQHSNNIKIAKRDPLIRETAIQEADSTFDAVRYLDSAWNDTNQPIGNSLTAGGTATRFIDNVFTATAGVRKLTRYGGIVDLSQRFGWQDNNSVFLVPNNQATSQLTLSYTHPLLRGRGYAYNNSLVLLASVDAAVAKQQFLATLQEELLEIARNYWALYLERAVLAHQMRLYLKTEQIFQALQARQRIDTQRTQLVMASSALENRRADLIRARTAVINAETRLRGLINAPELANSDLAELIPVEPPSVQPYSTDLQSEIQVALEARPEIKAAIRQVKAGSTQLGIARHELLPVLNLVTQTFANGLRGSNDFGGSFIDQFSDGRPSYSVGFQYELPVRNRAARARLCRRQHELSRLQDEYARALETVKTEVDIAVRELDTAYQEIRAKSRALAAAESEAETIEQRWLRMVDGNGTAALNLESLLRAQERVTETERDYVNSLTLYNLAMVNLKRANGTLLQTENININENCKDGCNDINLEKAGAAGEFVGEGIEPHLSGSVDPVDQLNVSVKENLSSPPQRSAKSNNSYYRK